MSLSFLFALHRRDPRSRSQRDESAQIGSGPDVSPETKATPEQDDAPDARESLHSNHPPQSNRSLRRQSISRQSMYGPGFFASLVSFRALPATPKVCVKLRLP